MFITDGKKLIFNKNKHMDLYTEINKGKGYAIFDIENMKLFKKIRQTFVTSINLPGNRKKEINDVRKFLAKKSKAEINKAMINFFDFNESIHEV